VPFVSAQPASGFEPEKNAASADGDLQAGFHHVKDRQRDEALDVRSVHEEIVDERAQLAHSPRHEHDGVVLLAGEAVALLYRGALLEPPPQRRVLLGRLLLERQEHEGEHELAESCGVQDGSLALDQTGTLEAAEAALDRARRETDLLAELEQGLGAVTLQQLEQPAIDVIERDRPHATILRLDRKIRKRQVVTCAYRRLRGHGRIGHAKMSTERPPNNDNEVLPPRSHRESEQWVEELHPGHPRRDQTVAKLHEVLLRVAFHELSRRRGQLRSIRGPEFDDLAHQAANDALMNVLAKLDQFRGLSRFTTWAYKFVMFEVSGKVARHTWRRQPPSREEPVFERMADVLALRPGDRLERREQLEALSAAIGELTERQREVFVAIALNEVPIDVVAVRLGSNRNAIYKNLFDARRHLRASLAAAGHPLYEADAA
jgi:RNA polymerase sigma-70 factor (ECF subfamily)